LLTGNEEDETMGWFFGFLSGVAALLMFETDHTILMAISIVAAAAVFWSWGKMRTYVTTMAKRSTNGAGGFSDRGDREAQGVPDWIAAVNMVCSVAGLVLLIAGIFFIIRS
jgi:hypothetical protein